jgi:hypothetical protein
MLYPVIACAVGRYQLLNSFKGHDLDMGRLILKFFFNLPLNLKFNAEAQKALKCSVCFKPNSRML